MQTKDYKWLLDESLLFLTRSYLAPGQTLHERVTIMAETAFDKILKLPQYKEEFIEGVKKGWYSFSTPEWVNFGNDRGLPISCFGCHVPDSVSGMAFHSGEVMMMSKFAGGTAGHWGDVRGRGYAIKDNGHSSGSVHFMTILDKVSNVISQGNTRRGSYAAYLNVDHPDIWEFLSIRGEGHPIQDMNFGVTIPEGWMESMLGPSLDGSDGDEEKKKIWARIIESRFNKGYPYVLFMDNVNKQRPDAYVDKNMMITTSQLCTEIFEYTSRDKSYVCCLGSMCLAQYDEWKDTNAIKLMTYFQDAVISEFLSKLEALRDSPDPDHQEDFYFMKRAYKFAKEHRSIGIGVLGYHTLLQKHMIPFESMEAKMLNAEIFRKLRDQTLEASKELAEMFGEPEILKGYGRRNSTLLAVAPTKSSSFILGQQSEGIQPLESNYYIQDRAKIKVTHRNPVLRQLLVEKGRDTQEVWNSILENRGSVQHLDFLSSDEKKVFKTFGEISQMEIVKQAAQRQQYIDQGQSLNIKVNKHTTAKEVSKLMIEAWQLGLKSLYYQISTNAAQDFRVDILECESCAS